MNSIQGACEKRSFFNVYDITSGEVGKPADPTNSIPVVAIAGLDVLEYDPAMSAVVA
jgi:hypothetical protein